MKTQLLVLTISSMILLSVSLHSKHTLLSPVYSAQEYFNSMNSTQQNFENKLSVLNSQIAEIETIIKDKNTTTSLKITSMSQKMADQRNSLYDIEQFLKIPYSLRLCEYPNLSDEEIVKLQAKVDDINGSIASLETNLSQCPLETCTSRSYFEQQIKNMKAYLNSIQQILNSDCRRGGYKFEEQKITGIVDLSNSLFKDNLKAPNWYFGSITEQQYKLRMFQLTTKFNISTCPLDRPFANVNLNKCLKCQQPNAIYNLGVRACLSCGNLSYLNLTTSLCNSCPPQMFYNSTKKQCQTCNFDQFLNTTSQKCQYCPPGEFIDNTSNACAACSLNTQYNIATRSCVPCNTTAAQFYSSTSKKCENCQNGYRYNQQKLVCQLCAKNSIYDKITGLCNPCKTGQYLDVPNMKCLPCQSGTYFNQTLQKCTACPNGTKFDSVLQKCVGGVQDVCPDDHPVYNAELNRCQSCPVGYSYIKQTKQCVNNNNIGFCPPDKPYYNFRNYACEACPSGTVFNPNHYGCDPIAKHRHQLGL